MISSSVNLFTELLPYVNNFGIVEPHFLHGMLDQKQLMSTYYDNRHMQETKADPGLPQRTIELTSSS
jgi:hypothetical protein